MTNKPTIRPLNDICTVKNASLFYDYNTDQYHLVHYDTEILTINKISENIQETDIRYEIVKALKCSNSSTRAIYQVTDFLNIPRQDIKLVPYTKFVKYNMSNNIRKKKNELMEIIEKWQN